MTEEQEVDEKDIVEKDTILFNGKKVKRLIWFGKVVDAAKKGGKCVIYGIGDAATKTEDGSKSLSRVPRLRRRTLLLVRLLLSAPLEPVRMNWSTEPTTGRAEGVAPKARSLRGKSRRRRSSRRTPPTRLQMATNTRSSTR